MSKFTCSPCLLNFCYSCLQDLFLTDKAGVNNLMKNLLFVPLLIFMAGCVTYYYPETALEDGVYYAEDDPSYQFNSADYSGVVYYPWSSLDYFYMGYWPYPNGFYGYYSPWYYSHYYGYYWRPNRWYCIRGGACNRRHPGNHFAVSYPDLHRNPGREDGEEYSPGEDVDMHRNSVSPIRYVTTAPPGYSGNQGMVIRSNKGSKIGKNRLEPVKSARSKPVSARSSTTGTVFRSPTTSSMRSRAPRSPGVSRSPTRSPLGKVSSSRRSHRD